VVAARVSTLSRRVTSVRTVRTLARQREIGVRKALGGSPARVALQFVTESVVAAWVACILAWTMAWSFAPIVSEWLDQPIRPTLFTGTEMVLCAVTATLVGVIAGAPAAYVALRIQCGKVLAGRDHSARDATVLGLSGDHPLSFYVTFN